MPIPMLAALAIGAGLKGLDTGLQMHSQNVANKANAQLMQKQLDYNWKALMEQERYNSPVNQRKMLEEAGYSPYSLFMQGGQASAGLSQSGSAPTMQPNYRGGLDMLNFDKTMEVTSNYDRLMSEISVNNANERLIRSNAKLNEIEALYREDDLLSKIAYQKANTKNLDQQVRLSSLQANLFDKTFADQVEEYKARSKAAQATAKKEDYLATVASLQVIAQKKENSWIDKIHSAELDRTLAETSVAWSQNKVNDQQYFVLIQEEFKKAAEKEGIRINNRRLSKTTWSFIQEQKANALKAERDAENAYDPFQRQVLGKEGNAFDQWSSRTFKNLGGAIKQVIPQGLGLFLGK